MVHLTYNGAERRKSTAECKIRAYIPIYPKCYCNPCQISPKQSAAYPGNRNRSRRNNQPQRIPCGLYHDIMPQQIETTAHHISRNRYRAIMPTVCRYHAGADREQPNRSSLSRSDRAGFFAALRSGELTAGS